MAVIHIKSKSFNQFHQDRMGTKCDQLQARLRHWHQARSWARLIREAENLWHVESREIRRLGALELSQLFQEIPPFLRKRVNRWLDNYSTLKKYNYQVTKLVDTNND